MINLLENEVGECLQEKKFNLIGSKLITPIST